MWFLPCIKYSYLHLSAVSAITHNSQQCETLSQQPYMNTFYEKRGVLEFRVSIGVALSIKPSPAELERGKLDKILSQDDPSRFSSVSIPADCTSGSS